MSFRVTFREDARFSVKYTDSARFKPQFRDYIEVPKVDWYDGEYAVTPSDTEQEIPIIGKTARQNITVGPIPSNYGLITWNGSTLMVS